MDRTVRAVRTPGGARGDEQLPSHSLDARSRCPRFLPRGRSRCWCSATRTTCPARSRSWNSSSRCAFLRPGYICKCDDSNGTAPTVHHRVTSVRLPTLGEPTSKCNLRILPPPSILKTRVAHSLMATRQRGFSVTWLRVCGEKSQPRSPARALDKFETALEHFMCKVLLYFTE